MDGATAYNNIYSVKNTGGYPAMFTQSGTPLQTWQPAAFTVEATFKLENGGYKTIVGRDSRGSVIGGDANLAAMYLQTVPNNGLAIKFCDVSGYWHEAVAPANSYIGFDWPTDPNGNLAPWYSRPAMVKRCCVERFEPRPPRRCLRGDGYRKGVRGFRR
jgi:hypothetical protein